MAGSDGMYLFARVLWVLRGVPIKDCHVSGRPPAANTTCEIPFLVIESSDPYNDIIPKRFVHETTPSSTKYPSAFYPRQDAGTGWSWCFSK